MGPPAHRQPQAPGLLLGAAWFPSLPPRFDLGLGVYWGWEVSVFCCPRLSPLGVPPGPPSGGMSQPLRGDTNQGAGGRTQEAI